MNDLIGVPFERLECWNLVREYYRRDGIELPDYTDETVYTHLREIAEPIKGSLLTFKIHNGEYIDHVGVFLGKNRFLHTTEQTGAVVHPLSYYRRFLAVVYEVIK